MQYHIAGNFQGRKLSQTGEKDNFHGENFHRVLACAVPKDTTPPNFAEKTFVNSHKTAKFSKVFFLKSFPLYGILNTNQRTKVGSPQNEPMYFVQQDKIPVLGFCGFPAVAY